MGRCTGRRRRRLPHASPAVSEADVNSFVDAADRVGVNHVVYLSTLGAEKNVIIPHHRIEKHIMGTDITYTLLRASFFMQNLLEVHRADIVEHDELFVPAGSGKTSFIDARDISEAASCTDRARSRQPSVRSHGTRSAGLRSGRHHL